MSGFSSSARVCGRVVLFALCCLMAVTPITSRAQSTFGAILGTVRDPVGAVVAGPTSRW